MIWSVEADTNMRKNVGVADVISTAYYVEPCRHDHIEID